MGGGEVVNGVGRSGKEESEESRRMKKVGEGKIFKGFLNLTPNDDILMLWFFFFSVRFLMIEIETKLVRFCFFVLFWIGFLFMN